MRVSELATEPVLLVPVLLLLAISLIVRISVVKMFPSRPLQVLEAWVGLLSSGEIKHLEAGARQVVTETGAFLGTDQAGIFFFG